MSPWRWQWRGVAWTHWDDTSDTMWLGKGNDWRRVVFGLWRRVG